jgi:hypothetical protein
VERGIEGALFDAEQLARDALDVEDDAVAVEGEVLSESLEDEQLECAVIGPTPGTVLSLLIRSANTGSR